MTIFLIDHEVTGQILEKYLKFLFEKLKLDLIKVGFSLLFTNCCQFLSSKYQNSHFRTLKNP